MAAIGSDDIDGIDVLKQLRKRLRDLSRIFSRKGFSSFNLLIKKYERGVGNAREVP